MATRRVPVVDRPLERLHPPIGPADDRQQTLDAEVVEKVRLRPHHVADRDQGNESPYGLPVFGSTRTARAGGKHDPITFDR